MLQSKYNFEIKLCNFVKFQEIIIIYTIECGMNHNS